jgi:hypothetical protein
MKLQCASALIFVHASTYLERVYVKERGGERLHAYTCYASVTKCMRLTCIHANTHKYVYMCMYACVNMNTQTHDMNA